MTAPAIAIPACPKCSGAMWDNRATKKNPKQPDFKCKDRECEGVVWPPKAGAKAGPQLVEPTPVPAAPPVDFATLCTRYAECVGYVVHKIVPGLNKAEVGTDPQSVAAMAATLFIARNQRNV